MGEITILLVSHVSFDSCILHVALPHSFPMIYLGFLALCSQHGRFGKSLICQIFGIQVNSMITVNTLRFLSIFHM